MAKKLKGKKRASGPHHGRGQPVAKRLSTPNPRLEPAVSASQPRAGHSRTSTTAGEAAAACVAAA